MIDKLDINGINLLGDTVPFEFDNVEDDLKNFTIRNVDITANFRVNSNIVKQVQILQCRVKSIKFIKNYFDIETLIIKNSNIKDLYRIKNCTKLKMLILDNVKIHSLRFLQNMNGLQRFDLMNCNIKKISSIKK